MPIDNAIPTDTSVAVSSWYFNYHQTLLSDPIPGWNFFMVAMTPNQALRSALLLNVYHRTVYSELPGAFPVYYDSANAATLGGVAR